MSDILRAAALAHAEPRSAVDASGAGAFPGLPRPRVLKAADIAQLAHLASEQTAQAGVLGARLDAVRAEGYAAGVAAARQEIEAQALVAGPRIAVALEQLAAESARIQGETVASTNDAVLSAALDIAGWILQYDPAAASASLLPRLTAAARTLAPGNRTVVRVSPEDLKAVTDWAREDQEVVPDSRLAPGEARLDRGEGSAVLTFAAALQRAAATLGVSDASADSVDGADRASS
jgi:flagellar biosynthesis/type III secretory pathway protein FliH